MKATFIYNPLEQFQVLLLYKLSFLGFDFSLTNVTLLLFIIIFIFFIIGYNMSTFLENNILFFFCNVYEFIIEMLLQQTNKLVSLRYFPLLFVIFLFNLFCNLVGLFPYGFTITSQIILTFQLSFSLFVGITIIGFYNNGFLFLKLFSPKGVPGLILPFLVIIEIVSYIIRPISLAVRLFANMLAGHALLGIVSLYCYNCFKIGLFVANLVLLFVFFVVVLEVCIACIQAYIFTMLLCIYIGDVYNFCH